MSRCFKIKILSVVIVGVLMLSLSACGSAASDSSDTSQVAQNDPNPSGKPGSPVNEDTEVAEQAATGKPELSESGSNENVQTDPATPDLSQFQNVIDLLDGGTWYFNGGSDTALNRISFSGGNASIAQAYYDGNGRHENGSSSFAYTIDETAIHVPTAGGGTLDIAYEVTDEGIVLGQSEYFTVEQVDAGLQGYWTFRETDSYGSREYNVYINAGSITAERANTAGNGPAGAYYYYGPDTGTYTLGFGNFNTQMSHGGEYFFNIVNGAPVLLHYGNVFSPGNGLPGENGYSFN